MAVPARACGSEVGRQPAVIHIVPSKQQPWYGAIVPDHRFTAQQLAQLGKRGLDPTTVGVLTVRRNATTREMYWPLGSLPPVYAFDCPVIAHGTDRVTVIAPDGSTRKVYLDGWTTPPPKRRRWR